jgi:hypothetical protein
MAVLNAAAARLKLESSAGPIFRVHASTAVDRHALTLKVAGLPPISLFSSHLRSWSIQLSNSCRREFA